MVWELTRSSSTAVQRICSVGQKALCKGSRAFYSCFVTMVYHVVVADRSQNFSPIGTYSLFNSSHSVNSTTKFSRHLWLVLRHWSDGRFSRHQQRWGNTSSISSVKRWFLLIKAGGTYFDVNSSLGTLPHSERLHHSLSYQRRHWHPHSCDEIRLNTFNSSQTAPELWCFLKPWPIQRGLPCIHS